MLEYEQWDIYIQFEGKKIFNTKMFRKDIKYFNLMSVPLEHGYGFSGCMYYMKNDGLGVGAKTVGSRVGGPDSSRSS